MKKFVSVSAILMVCVICLLSLAGCGDRTLDGKYKTVEAYLADPIVKSTLEESLGSDTDTTAIDVKAEGSNLVYEYVFTETYEADLLDIMKSSLESSTTANEATYKDVANSLKDVIANDDLGVIVRYINGDSTVIFEATYKADK